MRYPIDLAPDDNGTLLVTSPDFPELTTFGEDEADALRRAQGALVALLMAYWDDGRAIPRPSEPAGRPAVALPATLTAKIALQRALAESGLTQEQLGRRLGKDARQIRRILDPHHAGRFDDIEAGLAALGKRLVVSLVPDQGAARAEGQEAA